jgi:hypothetical protein
LKKMLSKLSMSTMMLASSNFGSIGSESLGEGLERRYTDLIMLANHYMEDFDQRKDKSVISVVRLVFFGPKLLGFAGEGAGVKRSFSG